MYYININVLINILIKKKQKNIKKKIKTFKWGLKSILLLIDQKLLGRYTSITHLDAMQNKIFI